MPLSYPISPNRWKLFWPQALQCASLGRIRSLEVWYIINFLETRRPKYMKVNYSNLFFLHVFVTDTNLYEIEFKYPCIPWPHPISPNIWKHLLGGKTTNEGWYTQLLGYIRVPLILKTSGAAVAATRLLVIHRDLTFSFYIGHIYFHYLNFFFSTSI